MECLAKCVIEEDPINYAIVARRSLLTSDHKIKVQSGSTLLMGGSSNNPSIEYTASRTAVSE